jgi:4-oxalocrotonate tautomerase family enzyme
VPVIQCDIREGRTEEQKQALAREITRVVHETIESPIEYIYVLIRETPARITSRAARRSRTGNPRLGRVISGAIRV